MNTLYDTLGVRVMSNKGDIEHAFTNRIYAISKKAGRMAAADAEMVNAAGAYAILKEPDGLVMIYKRLTAEGRYRWPRNSSEVRNLTWKEIGYLMDGIDIDQPKAIRIRRDA